MNVQLTNRITEKGRQISTAKCRGSSQDLPRERTVKRYAPKSKFTGAV